jgi:hypothetical protein
MALSRHIAREPRLQQNGARIQFEVKEEPLWLGVRTVILLPPAPARGAVVRVLTASPA